MHPLLVFMYSVRSSTLSGVTSTHAKNIAAAAGNAWPHDASACAELDTIMHSSFLLGVLGQKNALVLTTFPLTQ